MLKDIIVSSEQGRTAEDGTNQRSDTDFYALVLAKGKELYGNSFEFDRCVIDRQNNGTAIVTFESFAVEI